MTHSRRLFLRGMGGIALGLPFLEGLTQRKYAYAQEAAKSPFVIFFRQANGVAQTVNFKTKYDPQELFWPQLGPSIEAKDDYRALGFSAQLTNSGAEALLDNQCTVTGRAMEPLAEHLEQLLVLGGVRHVDMGGCGHANKVMQALTAASINPGACAESTTQHESIDHYIQRTLSRKEDHLYLFAGSHKDGWLGGEALGYSEGGFELTAETSPLAAYERVVSEQADVGLDAEILEQLEKRQRSVMDFLTEQFNSLLNNPSLSQDDLRRLEMHRDIIRDVENRVGVPLTCGDSTNIRNAVSNPPDIDLSTKDGDQVLQLAELHMDVCILAVLCGRNRSATIQVGNGNDGLTVYRRSDGSLMRNYATNNLASYHEVSHRNGTHSSSDLSNRYDNPYYRDHGAIDRAFARTFNHLVSGLKSAGILDRGMAVWFNDMGHGEYHAAWDIPWIIAGGAGGQLKQGSFEQLVMGVEFHGNGNLPGNHRAILNTIGAAVGLKGDDGEPIRNFGTGPENTEGPLDTILGGVELGSV
ncbi:MAG: DUF1552 domain-containing protein [Myxococcales bacterium]|nr:DUF1552 domain-containing protein [Myxococcales bacterium]